MSLLGQSEISFMPLSETRLNRAKSDLKFIEAGACRVVALASHVVYGGSIDDGRTGLLFRDTEELRARLLRLITMPDMARGVADAARAYVAAERMLAYRWRRASPGTVRCGTGAKRWNRRGWRAWRNASRRVIGTQ